MNNIINKTRPANMSKESNSILDAYYKGSNDKRLKKPYKNPYKKNKDRNKFKAYNNGYND